MSEELKSCPFCGSDDVVCNIFDERPGCNQCEASANTIAGWNRRHTPEGFDIADIQRESRIAELRILVGMLRCTPNEIGSRDHEYADWIEGRITAISASRPSDDL